jgi:hypothetical protein
MAEQPYPSPPILSRQLVQLMVEMKSQLRQYGVTIALTAPDAVAQLICAAEPIEDEALTQLRRDVMVLVSGETDTAQAPPPDSASVPAKLSLSQASCPALLTPLTPSPSGAAEPIDPTPGQDQLDSEPGVLATARGDRGPHLEVAAPDAVKVFLRAMQRDRLTCEQCQATLILPETQPSATGPLDLACTCGMQIRVDADRRRYLRKPAHFAGRYVELKRGERGSAVVDNISFGGVQFHTPEGHTLMHRDCLQLQFTLDDADQTVVSAPVRVRHVEGNTIGVRFVKSDPFDPRLAAYLIR